jgi:hypothetical protein
MTAIISFISPVPCSASLSAFRQPARAALGGDTHDRDRIQEPCRAARAALVPPCPKYGHRPMMRFVACRAGVAFFLCNHDLAYR